ncbi:MAG: hypothetical protein J6T90_00540 [Methanomicrobium sp.]|nr:hypothetical protein [Methanomicrobium sp.]
MPQFSCPKCGAALAVDPGTQIAKCQFCGTVTYVDRSEALFYYLLPFTIDEVKARGIFKRWTAGPSMAKELENGCKITKIVKEFFPVFRFRRSVNKSEKVFVRPARGTTLPGMHNLEIPPGGEVIYDDKVSIGDARQIDPDISIGSYIGEMPGNAIDQALVYFPIYEMTYEFEGKSYDVVIDGSSGRVYSGPSPSRGSAQYMAVMGVSFVLGLIGGYLACSIHVLFIVLAAGGLFAGRYMAQQVVTKKPAPAVAGGGVAAGGSAAQAGEGASAPSDAQSGAPSDAGAQGAQTAETGAEPEVKQ